MKASPFWGFNFAAIKNRSAAFSLHSIPFSHKHFPYKEKINQFLIFTQIPTNLEYHPSIYWTTFATVNYKLTNKCKVEKEITRLKWWEGSSGLDWTSSSKSFKSMLLYSCICMFAIKFTLIGILEDEKSEISITRGGTDIEIYDKVW